ncbi:Nramp family divalent metal transporter [Spirosoma utsteinense]|uniref:Mn2+/Fe2+ NRAMP family transporter n=1 Tax=Spirosoma utsteinense TaxID=2585773 RepID=A0ABR6WB94_9BACT|nr:Nramp family divalent metal transporter [Spirosoma utsteinense]MBC3793534.1 Mn2+/Fe2+ NRAMP family transporter [Spirosoma utsteinense]
MPVNQPNTPATLPPPDLYALTTDRIQSAPTTFLKQFRHLGPGFILSAAIVGSGELIATTALGAKAGFVAFWVILVSCFVKVALQLEFGKNAIYTGKPTMQSLNRLPGLRLGRGHWTIWLWLSLQTLKVLQVGGIVGGVALVLNMAFPAVPTTLWAILSAASAGLLIYGGQYDWVERGSLVMILLFTGLILLSLLLLQRTDYAISGAELAGGLTFSLPKATVGVAIAAFGITGVGGDEIMYYTYWCIEKGYAAYTGPNDGTAVWAERAKGWIRVMTLDALCAMVVYTTVTAAFYLLGASLLHAGGHIPEGYAMVETLSRLFTVTLGPGAKGLFLVGAFFVLYSTLFTATASWSRIFADAFGQLGWVRFDDPVVRKKTLATLSWGFPALWCVLFLVIKLPVLMVLLGGAATSVLLLVVIWAALQFRYRELPGSLKPTLGYDLWLWLSVLAILGVSVYGVWQLMG